MRLSIICPIRNEGRYIAQFLDSVMQQDFPKDDLEILLVDGMSEDKTRDVIRSYSDRYPFIKLINNPNKTVPFAMNEGIRCARGEIIIRLDAHAKYPTNYFSVLERECIRLGADNVGAICKTEVITENKQSLAIKEALSNPFGVGNSVFRTGTDELKSVDTVPFGCFPCETFKKYGFYDTRLTRNQDFELNQRIIQGGGKIYLVPGTYSTYYARDTLKGLWKQNYKNGLWGIRTVAFTGRRDSLALRHYIPMIFVLSLILPLIASVFYRPFIFVSLASLMSYLLAIAIVSAKAAKKKKLSFTHLVLAFSTLHISNGVGMLISIFTVNNYVKKINKAIKDT